jgi:hypothetical protein
MLVNTRFLSPDPAPGGGAAPTIKVQYNGAEIEIPRPEGLVPLTEVNEKYMPKSAFESELGRRVDGVIRNKGYKLPDELLGDEQFRGKAIESWGLKPDQTQAQLQEQLKKQAEQLNERELKPLQTKLTAAEKKLAIAQTKDLAAQILQTVAGKVKPGLLKSPATGAMPPIVSMLTGAYAHDDEHDNWYARGQGASGFQFSTKGDGTPYMTVAEHLANWLADPVNADFLIEQRQAGPGSKAAGDDAAPGGVVKGKTLVITEADARNPATYRLRKEEAQKKGLEIEIQRA